MSQRSLAVSVNNLFNASLNPASSNTPLCVYSFFKEDISDGVITPCP